jgi:hypothetical protein
MTDQDAAQSEPPQIDGPGLPDQLTRAWNLRSNEDQVLWRVFGTFWPTNAILLLALFRASDQLPDRWVGAIVCGSGILVSAVWFLIQRRCIGHMRRLEATADRLERRLRMPPEFALSARLNVQDYETHLSFGPRARTLMPLCTVLIGLLWLVGAVFFVCSIGCGLTSRCSQWPGAHHSDFSAPQLPGRSPRRAKEGLFRRPAAAVQTPSNSPVRNPGTAAKASF